MQNASRLARRLFQQSPPRLGIKIQKRDKQQALVYAREVSATRASNTVAFWTDASSVLGGDGTYACAAVSRDGDSWKTVTGILTSANTNVAEFGAVILALDEALRKVRATPGLKSVKILSDSATVLEWISVMVNGGVQGGGVPTSVVQGLWHVGIVSVRLRQLGARLEFHWVPRGQVEGNKMAHKASRLARDGGRASSAAQAQATLKSCSLCN